MDINTQAETITPGGVQTADVEGGTPAERTIPTDKAIAELRQACFHFADLYFHFAKVLFEELGAERGLAMIERAVRNRAEERAKAMRRAALARGLPLTVEG